VCLCLLRRCKGRAGVGAGGGGWLRERKASKSERDETELPLVKPVPVGVVGNPAYGAWENPPARPVGWRAVRLLYHTCILEPHTRLFVRGGVQPRWLPIFVCLRRPSRFLFGLSVLHMSAAPPMEILPVYFDDFVTTLPSMEGKADATSATSSLGRESQHSDALIMAPSTLLCGNCHYSSRASTSDDGSPIWLSRSE